MGHRHRKDKKKFPPPEFCPIRTAMETKKLTAVVREPRGKKFILEENHSPENTNQTLQQDKDTKLKQFYQRCAF